MLVLISYDIIESKKRNRIIKVIEQYGRRVQKSVFECDLEEKARKDVYAQLQNIMKDEDLYEESDSVRFYKICEKCISQTYILGQGQIELNKQYEII